MLKNIMFRVSNLSSFSDCPRRGLTRIIKTELQDMGFTFPEQSNNVAAAVGTAAHAGIKAFIDGSSISQAGDAGIAGFSGSVEVEYDSSTPDINTAHNQIRNIVNTFVLNVLKPLQADPEDLDCEHRLEATITPTIVAGTTYQFTLSGQPDLVVKNLRSIHDLKTGKSAEKYHAQLGGYVLLTKAMGETIPETCVIDHITRKKADYAGYTYSAELCESEARSAFMQASYIISRFLSSDCDLSLAPNNTSSMLCSQKYCSAYGTDFCPVSKSFNGGKL